MQISDSRGPLSLTDHGVLQNNNNKPVRIIHVSSKMHELAPGIDKDDPHFAKQRAYSSLAAYNRSKLAQVTCSSS